MKLVTSRPFPSDPTFFSAVSVTVAILTAVQVCAMLLFTHWNGCIQFLFASFDGFPEDSWVARVGIQNNDVSSQMLSIALGGALAAPSRPQLLPPHATEPSSRSVPLCCYRPQWWSQGAPSRFGRTCSL
eukprot:6602860-Prymnesium_polylepis.2